MSVEKLTDLISKSAGRLVKAVKIAKKDEKWWAALAKEDWNLIKLSWELRGLILRRGKGTGIELDDKLKQQFEEILKEFEGREGA